MAEKYQQVEEICRELGLPLPIREAKFHPVRQWKFDFAWSAYGVALEVDGGSWQQGRHTRGAGFKNDADKRNEAQLLGWIVLSCTPAEIKKKVAILTLLTRALTPSRLRHV